MIYYIEQGKKYIMLCLYDLLLILLTRPKVIKIDWIQNRYIYIVKNKSLQMITKIVISCL